MEVLLKMASSVSHWYVDAVDDIGEPSFVGMKKKKKKLVSINAVAGVEHFFQAFVDILLHIHIPFFVVLLI